MNAYEKALKSKGRINIMLNTQGYYGTLQGQKVLIYVAREAISCEHTNENSRRIYIVMLHLNGTRGDTKIWGENNFFPKHELPQINQHTR